MRITSVVNAEDCFDGGGSVRYWFDEPWNRSDIQRLASLGRLDYFPDFPRPFFRVVARNGMQLKGVEGAASCLIVFTKGGREAAQQEFEQLFR